MIKRALLLFITLSSQLAFSDEVLLEKIEKWLDNCYTQPIWNSFSPQVKNIFRNDKAEFNTYCQGIQSAFSVFSQKSSFLSAKDSITSTWWQIRTNPITQEEVQYLWSFDREKSIVGLYFGKQKKPAPSRFLSYQTKTLIEIPFLKAWEVLWGGRSVEENYHSAYQGQRFALDMLISKNGQSFRNSGKELSDYYCFGEKIISPGAGIIVSLEGNIKDNLIGEMNPKQPLGNHVVIDHGNGEFSFLAHLQQGSVKVKAGQKIELSQELARCGNSGNSSEPHLHYHLQNSSKLYKGEGLPITFRNIQVNGRANQFSEVKRGDIVKRN